MSWTGAMLSATGPLRVRAVRENHFMDELEPILRLKCDVSVVSNYEQIFVLVDAILQTGLWKANPR
jgi:hypothetical protein